MISALDEPKLCCVLVGLPARGKTFISRKISRYLNWLCTGCQVFNVGMYRRQMYGAQQPHHFFDSSNPIAEEQRHSAAIACLKDLLQWLLASERHQVAIYDATNTTIARRRMVTEECQNLSVQVMFIESILDDDLVVLDNVRMVKRGSPDYAEVDAELAVADFMARIAHYERRYERVGSSAISDP